MGQSHILSWETENCERMIEMREKRASDCAVVRDLLPSYIEHLTSEDTNEFVKEHLNQCSQCSEFMQEMNSEVCVDAVIENQNDKRAFRRARNLWIAKGILRTLLVTAIMVCAIVDLAVTKHLSWSFIVDASVLFAGAILETIFRNRRQVVLHVFVCISIGILPFLYSIELVVNNYYLNPPVHWFRMYALPITLVWLGLGWGVIAVWKAWKMNVWSVIGCVFLAALIGSPLTSMLAARNGLLETMKQNYEWIDMITYVIAAAFFFYIGRLKKRK